MSTPSIRKLWTMYKAILVKDGASRREQIAAQEAFYSGGARGVLAMMNHLLNEGDFEELERLIRRHGRTIQKLRGYSLRKRRH